MVVDDAWQTDKLRQDQGDDPNLNLITKWKN